MTKIYIIKSSSYIDNKALFPLSSSSYFKAWTSSDNETEEEDNIDTGNPESTILNMLESLSSSVCKLWMKQQIHINTYFTVTGWVLCVIPHICKDEKDHSDIDHRKQVINVIKTLFHGVPEDEMDVTLDIFWTEYTDFDKKIGSFDAD